MCCSHTADEPTFPYQDATLADVRRIIRQLGMPVHVDLGPDKEDADSYTLYLTHEQITALGAQLRIVTFTRVETDSPWASPCSGHKLH